MFKNLIQRENAMFNRKFITYLTLALMLATATYAHAADKPTDPKKVTKRGLYVTAREAYGMWETAKSKIKVLDCRTPEEYMFVGHAPMSYNIPLLFSTLSFNPAKKRYAMKKNQKFIKTAQKRFKKDDTILVMCRSGHRSTVSVNALTDAGFTKVYNIIDGFEGAKDSTGKRTVDGWKNAGLPWTYALDPQLVYQPKD